MRERKKCQFEKNKNKLLFLFIIKNINNANNNLLNK